MDTIKVLDKEFVLYIKEEQMLERINQVAQRINQDYQDKKPLFLAVLNGSFMFASDLMKSVTIPSEIQFVKLSSYQGTSTTGKVVSMIGIDSEKLKGRHVVIVEDIVDTGVTMRSLLESLQDKGAESIEVCTMLLKPDKLQVELELKYVTMEIPEKFIVGYGLDYDGFGRNLRDIYQIR